jgi:hypothetical protein
MSPTKDRLGRNPFDRSTYSGSGGRKSAAKTKASKSKSPKKAKAKTASAKRKAEKPEPRLWEQLVDEALKHAPESLKRTGVCSAIREGVSFVVSVLDRAAVRRG